MVWLPASVAYVRQFRAAASVPPFSLRIIVNMTPSYKIYVHAALRCTNKNHDDKNNSSNIIRFSATVAPGFHIFC